MTYNDFACSDSQNWTSLNWITTYDDLQQLGVPQWTGYKGA